MAVTNRPVLAADVRREDILLVLLLASREAVPVRVPGTLVDNLLELVVKTYPLLDDLLPRREALLCTEVLLPLADSFVFLPSELVRDSEDDVCPGLLVPVTPVLSENS